VTPAAVGLVRTVQKPACAIDAGRPHGARAVTAWVDQPGKGPAMSATKNTKPEPNNDEAREQMRRALQMSMDVRQ
jgi:hypothetical protein